MNNMQFTFTVPDMKPTEGVQKVKGFSRGWHHWNSIRLGIRKENDYCVLYFYAYIRGERIIQRLGKVAIGDSVDVALKWGNYVSVSANEMYAFRVAPRWSCPIGYKLGEYAEDDYTGKQVPFGYD